MSEYGFFDVEVEEVDLMDHGRASEDGLTVYNLSVEEDESFVIGERGLVVHNCRHTVTRVQE